MAIERRRFLFTGHVQGVGFRMTARRLALGWPLAGFVRNLADGRVELVLEAEPDIMARYLAAIQHDFAGSIRETVEIAEPVADVPMNGFAIR